MDIKITADRPTSDIPIAINFNTSSTINFLDLSFSAIVFSINYPKTINQIIIKTNGKTTLPKGLALSNSNDIFGLLIQLFKNLYKSVTTKAAVAARIKYKSISGIWDKYKVHSHDLQSWSVRIQG